MEITKLYIVDDHKIIIDGISSFLIGHSDYQLIGSALSAKELFEDLKELSPNIILLDIKLPGLSGIQIAKIITKEYPEIRIIFISAEINEDLLNDTISAGGKGYFSKDVDEEEFFIGLNKIANGENYFSKGIQKTLFNTYSKQVSSTTAYRNDNLTEREIDVIKLFADGLSFKEIANKLNISSRTVETHKKNINEKLNINNTAQLVKYAIINGLSDL